MVSGELKSMRPQKYQKFYIFSHKACMTVALYGLIFDPPFQKVLGLIRKIVRDQFYVKLNVELFAA